MPPRNVYIIAVAAALGVFCHLKAEKYRDAAVVGDAVSYIERFYVEPVDKRDLINSAMAGLTSKLDPYTQYIPPGAYDVFQEAIEQEFAGIGILIERPEGTETTRVVTPLVGSPALEAGFLPGDQIINVAGVSTETAEMNKVSDLLRGPVGTEVTVRVRRTEQPVSSTASDDLASGPKQIELDLNVVRANIQLDSVAGDYRNSKNEWVYRLAEAPDVAYIRLSGFGERTTREFQQVLKDLDNDFSGLVLDLRGNSGGLLGSAVEICDMFLDEGVIVSTRGRGIIQSADNPNAVDEEAAWYAEPGVLVEKNKPITVLVDRDSASASEIVAACLKDHGRAIVVGERSFGKGSVQNVFPLENGRSALKLTTARYYRPNGKNIHRKEGAAEGDDWGVRPSDGHVVRVDDEARRRLYRRLETATYPSLTRAYNTSDDSIDSLEEVDPQLTEALKTIRGDLRDDAKEKPETDAKDGSPSAV